MQHFKQRAKKWLSGFLAAVMLFGMLPSMGLFNPAYAAGGATTPPATIKNTTRDVKYGKIEGRNPITGELIMNVPGHTSVIPRLFEFAGDDGSEAPGFCADHKLNFDGKVVPSLTWKNPVPVVGSKYEKVLPIVANFMVSYKQAEWMADQLSGMGDMTEAELDEWCAANAQGYYPGDLSWSHYSYWGQKGSGDWTWNYKVTNMGAQAAIWLAGADLLSPGPTLTDEDLEKIAGLQMLTLYEMYGKGQGWKLTKESAEGVPGNPGWYAEGVSLRVGWYKSAVERPKGRSTAKFFCKKMHRSNRLYRSNRSQKSHSSRL